MVGECIKLPPLGPGPLHMMDHSPQAKHLISLSEKINKLRNHKNGGEKKGRHVKDGYRYVYFIFKCCFIIRKRIFVILPIFFYYLIDLFLKTVPFQTQLTVKKQK